MIYRISELKPKIIEKAESLGWTLKGEAPAIEFVKGNEKCILDWRDTAGPVSEGSLRRWIEEYRDADQIILMTMGFFDKKAYGHILSNKDLRKRTVLIEFGLRDYFDETLKPKKLVLRPSDIFLETERVIGGYGLPLQSVSCDFCSGKPANVCADCKAIVCKDHIITCPMCRGNFCHPDLTGNRCFFKHICGESQQELKSIANV